MHINSIQTYLTNFDTIPSKLNSTQRPKSYRRVFHYSESLTLAFIAISTMNYCYLLTSIIFYLVWKTIELFKFLAYLLEFDTFCSMCDIFISKILFVVIMRGTWKIINNNNYCMLLIVNSR